jgi:hypothetical protein
MRSYSIASQDPAHASVIWSVDGCAVHNHNDIRCSRTKHISFNLLQRDFFRVGTAALPHFDPLAADMRRCEFIGAAGSASALSQCNAGNGAKEAHFLIWINADRRAGDATVSI